MPKTRYAKSDDVNIAYQVIGDGPRDVLHVPGFVSNVEVMWEDPGLTRFLERVASFSRLIIFDKRGTGLSDPVSVDDLPSLEVRMDDVRAVMDAVGSASAILFGHSEGGAMCALFAGTYPDRTEGLILAGSRVRWRLSPEEIAAEAEETERRWGDGKDIADLAPSRDDDAMFREWLGRYERLSASPRTAANLVRMNAQVDVSSILPAIRVPTLLLYRVGDPRIEDGRYIAAKVDGSKLVGLPGIDHFFWAGDTTQMLEEIEEFVTGHRVALVPDRVVATVMFTDIVNSTDMAARLGDGKWRDLLHRHNEAIRSQLVKWRGVEVKTTGDGFLATFDGPARAIQAARSIIDTVKPLGIEVRVGLHTGELEETGADVAGVAVHIASRISELAGRSEVLVSRTVKDLVAGSRIEFSPRGRHVLKGIPDEWETFAAH